MQSHTQLNNTLHAHSLVVFHNNTILVMSE